MSGEKFGEESEGERVYLTKARSQTLKNDDSSRALPKVTAAGNPSHWTRPPRWTEFEGVHVTVRTGFRNQLSNLFMIATRLRPTHATVCEKEAAGQRFSLLSFHRSHISCLPLHQAPLGDALICTAISLLLLIVPPALPYRPNLLRT